MNSLVARFSDETTRRSNILLLVFGMLMAVAFLANSVVIYDDLYIPRHYSELVGENGRWHAAWIIFTGGDLTREYRTYGLSRTLQFALWNVIGGKSFVYPLIISISQLATAFVLITVLRRNRVPEAAALVVALMWVISPFATTWTFHHYSYLILPFQVLIVTLFVYGRIQTYRHGYLIAALLGIACALTGEMQLMAAMLIFLFYLLRFRLQIPGRAAAVSLLAFGTSLVLHRLHWVFFVRNDQLPQRFGFQLADQGWDKLASLARAAIFSIYVSLERQTTEILSAGAWVGLCAAVLSIVLFLFCIGKSEGSRGLWGRIELRLAAILLLVGVVSISLYVAIAVLSGAQVFVMPRRYGYVPLTLILAALVLAMAELINLLSWPSLNDRRIGYAVGLGFFAVLTAQLQIKDIPAERRLDDRVSAEALVARGPVIAGDTGGKTVLLYVASERKYQQGLGDGSTIGPKTDNFERRELFESPWGIFWNVKSHLVDFLGFNYVAMTSHCRTEPAGDGRTRLGCDSEWAHPIAKNRVETKDVVVIANLGLEQFDPEGKKIVVFKTYEEFVPNDFGRRIERDVLRLASVFSEEFSIDLGQKELVGLASSGTFPDKSFSEPWSASSNWVRNYGLASGADGVYSHPDIRKDLASYKTNRNSAFSYRVEFVEPTNVEVSFDFWEQWGRRPGERLFNLDVSWNGKDWANVDVVDMAAINGNKPFSIVLSRAAAPSFEFRLRPVEGTMDVPVIQNLRLRKL